MSKIEWTERTWNPSTGCDRVSPGCDHCYALTMAGRLKKMGQPKYQTDGDPATSGPGFGLAIHPDVLDVPLRRRVPTTYFLDSMSDLFHPDVPSDFICQVWEVMGQAQRHTFQVLTKRPQRMAALLSLNTPTPWPNVWAGTSIESDRYVFRARHLRETPAAVRFLSLEPLLGPLPSLDLEGIDWVIVGGESGKGARPMHPDWARDIRDRCVAAGVPFFLKQWGQHGPEGPDSNRLIVADDGTTYGLGDLDWPDGPRRGEAIRAGHDRANLTTMYRVGKKAAGRELDGRTWDEMPARAVVV